jgi:hypothetical protein
VHTCTPYWRVLVRHRSDHWRARLLRHGPRGFAWWCCRAGAYVSGASGSNECPAGSVRIETEAACRTAAAAAGKPEGSSSYPFVDSYVNYPRGCFYETTSSNAWFNTHAVGAGYSAQLLCAAATTGAPLPH